VLVPINFRLSADEVAYIVEHCGARVLLVDPELDEALAGRHRRAPLRARRGVRRGAAAPGVEPVPWEEPDEDATATINYTSGTTARPKGVQITHRNIWVNAVTFACTPASPTATSTCTRCRCSTATAGGCRSR
jgi:long-subunit acyl-CoA synthetase (AMP-forming)